MKKIRDFKLPLHFKEIRLRARRKFDLEKLGLDDENLSKLIAETEAKLQASVIYESFGPENSDTARLAPVPGLAHTLGLATLGPDLGPYVVETREISEARGRLLDMIATMALRQAVHFVVSLLKDEIEAEQCELSPIDYLEGAAIRPVFDKLDGSKILLQLRNEELSPEYSAAFCMSWLAKHRGRKKRSKTSSGGRRT